MKILIIDDDEVDYLATRRVLMQAFEKSDATIFWIQDPEHIDYIEKFSDYDVCIIDQNLGQVKGVEIIRRMYQSGCLAPMILLTGSVPHTLDHTITECGASDYLLKDEITPTLLNRSIRFAISQKKNEKKLIELAYQDGLTGIANRKRFDEFAESTLFSSSRSHLHIALVLLDLDNFKLVNDTYGHAAGDKLLRQVALRLTRVIRDTDLVARLGGDEFAIAITMMQNEDDIETVLSKIRLVFAEPFELGHETYISCSASIGATTPSLNEKITYEEMFRRADLSLYGAKFNGKKSENKQPFASNPFITAPVKIPSRIQNALADREFQMFYQPKINTLDHSIGGAEALIRWFPEGIDPIQPQDFIPAAEISGDIISIGEWSLDTVCGQIKYWQSEAGFSIPIAINMSPLQIGNEKSAEHIQNALDKHDLSPELLEIEITETASLRNEDLLLPRLKEIQEIGCKITVDDFGIGYSSLLRFLDLPISSLKIDRTFVRRINSSHKANAICKSIVALAQNLDIPVTAEGIETPEQLQTIRNMECEYGQGFYFKKPVSAAHFTHWQSSYVN